MGTQAVLEKNTQEDGSFVWEELDPMTFRLQVESGYIYRYGMQGYCWTPVMIFVPK